MLLDKKILNLTKIIRLQTSWLTSDDEPRVTGAADDTGGQASDVIWLSDHPASDWSKVNTVGLWLAAQLEETETSLRGSGHNKVIID